ncbi:MAG: hypothetical protein FD123_3993 [Bacteroidetes bacterium]|nr:MAG: hypothetical protein FD123_3993 [Bacteroidota bacterium]
MQNNTELRMVNCTAKLRHSEFGIFAGFLYGKITFSASFTTGSSKVAGRRKNLPLNVLTLFR